MVKRYMDAAGDAGSGKGKKKGSNGGDSRGQGKGKGKAGKSTVRKSLGLAKRLPKYDRGKSLSRQELNAVGDKKLRTFLARGEQKYREAKVKAARMEILNPEEAGTLEAEGMERTFRFKQEEIRENVDITAAGKAFDLSLTDFGPYAIDYTRNGRYLLLGGRKGHLALMDWNKCRLKSEVQVKETVRDVTFLHNETRFAVAQKKYVYVYDETGMEVHCLRKHFEINKLDFLPFHYLMVSVGHTGMLRYQDSSTGELVAEYRTKQGSCNVLAQNPANAVMHLGHNNGTVSLWTPNMGTYAVKMLCHRGPVTAAAVDPTGNYMVTGGLDKHVKVWDLRTYQVLHSYFAHTAADTIDVSQRGIIGVGYGPHVQFWKDGLKTKQMSPYLQHTMPGSRVQDVRFVGYEDVCGIGHANGFTSVLVPGAGEPNFDSFAANPFQTKKQQREGDVRALLDKLPSSMISLDARAVGNVDRAPAEVIAEERKLADEANKVEKRKRGKTRGKRKHARRMLNIVERQNLTEEQQIKHKRRAEIERKQAQEKIDEAGPALGRFMNKVQKPTFQ